MLESVGQITNGAFLVRQGLRKRTPCQLALGRCFVRLRWMPLPLLFVSQRRHGTAFAPHPSHRTSHTFGTAVSECTGSWHNLLRMGDLNGS